MQEIRSLTGIRGFAALWVLLLHYGDELTTLIPEYEALRPFFGKGHIGVDLFFILSGFIITYVYASVDQWNRTERFDFFVKRVARIYPVHLFTLVSLAVLVIGATAMGKTLTGNYTLKEFGLNLMMLQAFPISEGSWNYPSWSISAEFFGYLAIFPLTVLLFRSETAKKYCLFICASIIVAFVCLKNMAIFGRWEDIASISFEFATGAALYYGLKSKPSIAPVVSKLLPAIFVLFIATCFIPPTVLSDKVVRGLLIIMCPVLITGMSTDTGRINKFLGLPMVRYFGLISYSLYMSHANVEKVFKVLLPTASFAESSLAIRVLVFAIHIIVPFIAAILTYHFCEEPARRLIQKWSKSWRPAANNLGGMESPQLNTNKS